MTALVLSLVALALSLASCVLAVKTARLRRRIDAHLAGRPGEPLEPQRRIDLARALTLDNLRCMAHHARHRDWPHLADHFRIRSYRRWANDQ